MIHTNELMLGNWVEYATGLNKDKRSIPMYVKAIFRDEVYLDFEGNEGDVWEEDAENLLGIPITEELLEKCGFNEFRRLGGYVAYSDNFGKMLCLDHGEFRLSSVDAPLKYLHELQNAYFMLTKNHLEVKL